MSPHEIPASETGHAPDEEKEDSSQSKRLAFVILAIVLGIGLFFGIRAYLHSRTHVETDNAQIEGSLYPVLSRVSGYAQAVQVRDNQKVSAGEKLVQIDPKDLQARVLKAEAALENAKSKLLMAQAKLKVAQAQKLKADQDLKRLAPLAQKKEISSQQFDGIQTQQRIAHAEYEAAQRQVHVAQAEVDQKGAELETENLQLSYASITAPTSGWITRKNVEPGQYIQPGQPLFTIVSDKELWVVANFKETQLTHLRPGQPVEIRVDVYRKKVFRGHVESIQSGTGARFSLLPPENATGNFVKVVQRIPVKIVFDEQLNADFPIVPGMSVVPEVQIK